MLKPCTMTEFQDHVDLAKAALGGLTMRKRNANDGLGNETDTFDFAAGPVIVARSVYRFSGSRMLGTCHFRDVETLERLAKS